MGSSNSCHLGCFCNPLSSGLFILIPVMNILYGTYGLFNQCNLECGLPLLDKLSLHLYLLILGISVLLYELICIVQWFFEDMEGDRIKISGIAALNWLVTLVLIGWVFIGAGLFVSSTLCKANGDYDCYDMAVYPYFSGQVILSLLLLISILIFWCCQYQCSESDPETRAILQPGPNEASIQGGQSDQHRRLLMELKKGPNFIYWISSRLPGTRTNTVQVET
ncbi:uncharacterized protein [Amphiura filiformis]|uniref:uncharacterized protein n=1 Tax=Amphiura filiformis TaxID=82378 RepID=UPI003B21F940